MTISRFLRISSLLSLLAISGLASAQYVWIDASGVKQYSDRPPPGSVPKDKILKDPRRNARADVAAAPAAAPAADAANGSKSGTDDGPPSLADQNAAFNKRQKEKQEADKKAQAAQQNLAMKRQNCERARAYAETIQSGQRMSTVVNGERVFLDDDQRANEMRAAQQAIATNCN